MSNLEDRLREAAVRAVRAQLPEEPWRHIDPPEPPPDAVTFTLHGMADAIVAAVLTVVEADRATLLAHARAMAEALEEWDWTYREDGMVWDDPGECCHCGHTKREKHADDCLIGNALSAFREWEAEHE